MEKGKNQTKPKQTVWRDIVPAKKSTIIAQPNTIDESNNKLAKEKPKKPKKINTWLKTKKNVLKLKIQSIKEKKIRKRLFIGLIIIVVIAVGLSSYFLFFKHKSSTSKKGTVYTTQNLVKGDPDYKTIIPNGKNIKDLGGWTRISPTDRNPVYAYVDQIGDIKINVSEQPLPEDFQSDTANQIELLAKSFKATAKINIGNLDVYLGASVSGPQSVIFTKNNLLILIKSTAPIANSQWAEYIDSLQ